MLNGAVAGLISNELVDVVEECGDKLFADYERNVVVFDEGVDYFLV